MSGCMVSLFFHCTDSFHDDTKYVTVDDLSLYTSLSIVKVMLFILWVMKTVLLEGIVCSMNDFIALLLSSFVRGMYLFILLLWHFLQHAANCNRVVANYLFY